MNNTVKQWTIIDANDGTTIFDKGIKFEIPLYQREYAWEDKHIIQLIEDISSIPDTEQYYVGSLIVADNGKIEVVDGQQRLTTLFLLLNCLGMTVSQTLSFECREKSNYTLKNISKIIVNNENELEQPLIQNSIRGGIKIIQEAINAKGFNQELFKEQLSRVVLYQIEVPEHTDMNRYFEVMNTRGEQLEQHDILKAQLMSYLDNEKEKDMFSIIWNACSDMSGYVQMHFISPNNCLRDLLFSKEWNAIPRYCLQTYAKDFSKIQNLPQNGRRNKNRNEHCSIVDIIQTDYKVGQEEIINPTDERSRFESIIEFPYFLLHTLKVFIAYKNIRSSKPKNKLTEDMLDDKKLITSFQNVIENGIMDNGKLKNESIQNIKKEFSQEFIIFLLQTRMLFDQYIIKREYANNSADGTWSLKTLFVSGQGSQKKPYYKNSRLTRPGTWEKTNSNICKNILMLQSAYRVSYTSPKVMHWITKLLTYLMLNRVCRKAENIDLPGKETFTEVTEKIAITEVEEFLQSSENLKLGTSTPHIILNYLDYLLWSTNQKEYDDFTFEFRNSVEHWYPQHPSDDTFEKWDDVDRFGNLCLLPRNVNSKFSNLAPVSKLGTFKAQIEKGSLKMREMAKLTQKNEDWRNKYCEKHERDMIEILEKRCLS